MTRRAFFALALALALLAPSTAWATAITSAANGNWSSTSTWTGGVVPGAGDTVTINKVVTITTDTTIGDGTASTVVTCLTGQITVNAGVTWTIRGNGTWGQSRGGASLLAVLTLQAGASVVLDGNSGVNPVQTFATDSKVVVNGTSGSHCTIRTLGATAGLPGRFVNNLSGTSELNTVATYCDFVNLGDSTHQGWGPVDLNVQGESDIASFDHCTFNNCGYLYISAVATDGTISLTHCTFTGSLGPQPLLISTSAANTTGTRLVQDCVFFGKPNFANQHSFTISRCYFDANLSVNYSGGQWASFDGNIVRKPVNEESTLAGNVSNSYWFYDPAATSAFAGFYLISSTGSSDHTNNVFDNQTTDGSGYGVGTTDGVSVNRTVNVTGNVMTANASGGASGAMAAVVTSAGQSFSTTMNVYHNTAPVGSVGGVELLTASVAPTTERVGALALVRDNLFWRTGSAANYAVNNTGGTHPPVTDAVAGSAIHHNALCGLATITTFSPTTTGDAGPENGTSYNSPMSGATVPGASDVALGTVADLAAAHTQGPKFVDPTRNLAAWSVSKGYAVSGDSLATKVAAALAQIRADTTLIADAVAWVRAGFVTQQSSLATAASDGTAIGAMPFVSPQLPVPVINGGIRRRASLDRRIGPLTLTLDLLDPTRRRRKVA